MVDNERNKKKYGVGMVRKGMGKSKSSNSLFQGCTNQSIRNTSVRSKKENVWKDDEVGG